MKKDLFIIYGGIAMLVVIVFTLKVWLFGSLAVSSIKAVSDDCGKEYPVEIFVINGNWFCSND